MPAMSTNVDGRRAGSSAEPKISASCRSRGVGHADHADVRLDRGERVVRREHVVLGQGVEEGRLADVGQADDADGEATGVQRYGPRRTPVCRRVGACSAGRQAASSGSCEEDLGAVGAVGAPSAVGLSLDPEAVVDLGVVPFAEQGAVLHRGRAVVELQSQDVVDVAPVGGGVAAGEHAVPVADVDGPAQVRRERRAWCGPTSSGWPSGPMTIRVMLPSQASQRARAAEIRRAEAGAWPRPGRCAGRRGRRCRW